MKQPPLLYAPEAVATDALPPQEAHHALRVLRLQRGDAVVLVDGNGGVHQARLTEVTPHTCRYTIKESRLWQKPWAGHIHLAIAPTKNSDRMEWLMEKVTELGIDELTPLLTHCSERKTLRLDRLTNIAISAMKQSLKGTLPRINPLTPFCDFVATARADEAFICHCHDQGERLDLRRARPTPQGSSLLVMVGPEGDFTLEEVEAARSKGFHPASLGECRLRTETAGIVAVQLMHLMNLL